MLFLLTKKKLKIAEVCICLLLLERCNLNGLKIQGLEFIRHYDNSNFWTEVLEIIVTKSKNRLKNQQINSC